MSTKNFEFLIWSDQTVDEIFNELDLNGNNVLTRSEIKIALSARGVPITKTLINDIFQTCDKSKEGSITRAEFKEYSEKQHGILTKIFKEMDKSKNELLSFKELKSVIGKINPDYSDNQIRYMIQNMDLNHNGQIDLKDFVKFYHLVPIHNAKMAFDLFSREHIDFGENFAISEGGRGLEDQKVK